MIKINLDKLKAEQKIRALFFLTHNFNFTFSNVDNKSILIFELSYVKRKYFIEIEKYSVIGWSINFNDKIFLNTLEYKINNFLIEGYFTNKELKKEELKKLLNLNKEII